MMQVRQIIRYQAMVMMVTPTLTTEYFLTVLFVISFVCIGYQGILVVIFNYVITCLQTI